MWGEGGPNLVQEQLTRPTNVAVSLLGLKVYERLAVALGIEGEKPVAALTSV